MFSTQYSPRPAVAVRRSRCASRLYSQRRYATDGKEKEGCCFGFFCWYGHARAGVNVALLGLALASRTADTPRSSHMFYLIRLPIVAFCVAHANTTVLRHHGEQLVAAYAVAFETFVAACSGLCVAALPVPCWNRNVLWSSKHAAIACHRYVAFALHTEHDRRSMHDGRPQLLST